VGKAAVADAVTEETADATEEGLILDVTCSVIWCATETGTVYDTKRWSAAKVLPTTNCIICIVVRVRLTMLGTR
jgi:hypothetical protein